jgi:hypothetical protein
MATENRPTHYFTDTHPDAEAVLMRLLRNAPSWRKIEMVMQLNAQVRTLMLSGLRLRHPHTTEAQLRRRMADLLLGSELAAQAYGPLKDE